MQLCFLKMKIEGIIFRKFGNFFKKCGKNKHFWGKSAQKIFQNRGYLGFTVFQNRGDLCSKNFSQQQKYSKIEDYSKIGDSKIGVLLY